MSLNNGKQSAVDFAERWFENLGSERDWNFVDQPNPHVKGRSMPLGMGRCLAGDRASM
jgi:choline dehydrogenase